MLKCINQYHKSEQNAYAEVYADETVFSLTYLPNLIEPKRWSFSIWFSSAFIVIPSLASVTVQWDRRKCVLENDHEHDEKVKIKMKSRKLSDQVLVLSVDAIYMQHLLAKFINSDVIYRIMLRNKWKHGLWVTVLQFGEISSIIYSMITVWNRWWCLWSAIHRSRTSRGKEEKWVLVKRRRRTLYDMLRWWCWWCSKY